MTTDATVALTSQDRQTLDSYENLLNGLADYLGNSFEFVLHSLENLDSSVIKIINGYHTNRKIGAPITDLALNMLEQISSESDSPGYISYFSKNKYGEPLKATTIAIYGEKGRIIGLLCINFYLNTPLLSLMQSFSGDQSGSPALFRKEYLAESADEMISRAVSKASQEIKDDDSVPISIKNRYIIGLLYDQGVFNVKEAVSKTAELLGISKNTVYLHLRSCKEQSAGR